MAGGRLASRILPTWAGRYDPPVGRRRRARTLATFFLAGAGRRRRTRCCASGWSCTLRSSSRRGRSATDARTDPLTGIADGAESSEALLRRVDEVLYRAKLTESRVAVDAPAAT